MGQPRQLAFIVALRDADDAIGLARLLEDLQMPGGPAVFLAPPVRGSELLTAERHHAGSYAEELPAGSAPVYLLDHEPGLSELLRGVDGSFYVGVPAPAVAAEYDDSVSTFLAGGPLDFATVIMRDYSRPDAHRGLVFDEGEALRMAALASDFPIDLDDDFQVAVPVVDSVMIGSDRFYGRAHEQRTFRQLLEDIIATPPETASKIDKSYILLIYGIGGMGKTTLCARLCDIAREEDAFRGRIRIVTLNWDNHKAAIDDMKVVMETENTALGLLTLVGSSFGDSSQRYFQSFHKLTGQIREAEARASEQLRDEDDEFSALSKIGIAGAKLLVTSTIPPELAGVINMTADQLPILARQAKAWMDRLRREDRELILRSERLLIDAFAVDIRAASRERPIVVLLDTYEIISWADERWLRLVFGQTGPRVAWVLAGRFTDKQKRSYKVHWLSQRLIPLPLEQLTVYETEAYFNDGAPERPLQPDSIGALFEATGGIPLAVYLAANMWRDGASLGLIIGNGDMGDLLDDELVENMVDRFLKYAREDESRPHDYDRLCSLALLPDRRDKPDDEDADLLAVLWGVDQVGPVLEELEARYEFVIARRARLHDEVRKALRRHLLNAVSRRDLRVRNRPAIEYLSDRLAERQGQLATLEARCGDEQWKKNVLGLSWHRFWDSYEAGWATVVSALPAAIAFDAEFGNALLDQSDHFAVSTIDRHRLRLVRESLGEYSYLTTRTSEQALAELARPQRGVGVQPNDGCAGEQAAILAWQRALNLVEARNLTEALRYFDTAAHSLPADSIALRESLARDIAREAFDLVWSETEHWFSSSGRGLEMARLATQVSPGDGESWRTLGNALWAERHYDEAVAAYTQGVQISADSEIYNELGIALAYLARYDESLNALNRAIELGPSTTMINNRAIILHWYGRYEDALLATDEAIAIEPERASIHGGRARTLLELGQLDMAEEAALKATQLDPEGMPEAWLIAGAVALDHGQIDVAQERFVASLNCTKSATMRSPFSRATTRALALSCTGQGEEAVEILRNALPDRLPGDRAPTGTLELLADCASQAPTRFDDVRALIEGVSGS